MKIKSCPRLKNNGVRGRCINNSGFKGKYGLLVTSFKLKKKY